MHDTSCQIVQIIWKKSYFLNYTYILVWKSVPLNSTDVLVWRDVSLNFTDTLVWKDVILFINTSSMLTKKKTRNNWGAFRE
jgi:hypothetical protein